MIIDDLLIRSILNDHSHNLSEKDKKNLLYYLADIPGLIKKGGISLEKLETIVWSIKKNIDLIKKKKYYHDPDITEVIMAVKSLLSKTNNKIKILKRKRNYALKREETKKAFDELDLTYKKLESKLIKDDNFSNKKLFKDEILPEITQLEIQKIMSTSDLGQLQKMLGENHGKNSGIINEKIREQIDRLYNS
jgi:hypothetical protein